VLPPQISQPLDEPFAQPKIESEKHNDCHKARQNDGRNDHFENFNPEMRHKLVCVLIDSVDVVLDSFQAIEMIFYVLEFPDFLLDCVDTSKTSLYPGELVTHIRYGGIRCD
jgi:hypothetical protein